MRFSEFKRYANETRNKQGLKLMIDLNDLVIVPAKHNQNVKLVQDMRTDYVNGIFRVRPIAFSGNNVIIVCPFCGTIHFHGGTEDDYKGTRSAHCKDDDGSNDVFEEYELI